MTEKSGRTSRIEVRLTPGEASRIRARARASGLNLSAYVRRAALADDAPTPAVDARALRPAYTELRRCGNNANQIARVLNTYGADADTMHVATTALAELERAAQSVAEELARARG